jgi:hypothetical protein
MIYILVSVCSDNCGSGYCKAENCKVVCASADKSKVEVKHKECVDLNDRFRKAYAEMKEKQKEHKIPLYLEWLQIPKTPEFREYMNKGGLFNEHPSIAAQNAEHDAMKKDRDDKMALVVEDLISKYNLPAESSLYYTDYTYEIQEAEEC